MWGSHSAAPRGFPFSRFPFVPPGISRFFLRDFHRLLLPKPRGAGFSGFSGISRPDRTRLRKRWENSRTQLERGQGGLVLLLGRLLFLPAVTAGTVTGKRNEDSGTFQSRQLREISVCWESSFSSSPPPPAPRDVFKGVQEKGGRREKR